MLNSDVDKLAKELGVTYKYFEGGKFVGPHPFSPTADAAWLAPVVYKYKEDLVDLGYDKDCEHSYKCYAKVSGPRRDGFCYGVTLTAAVLMAAFSAGH